MIKVSRDAIIYILAPGNIASGGPEALHQLHYYLNKLGYQSKLAYYSNPQLHPRYEIYQPNLIAVSEICDEKQNIIIVPEINSKFLKSIKHCKKCVWWLGVQLFDGFETFPRTAEEIKKAKLRDQIPLPLLILRQFLIKLLSASKFKNQPYLIRKNDYNLCGSKFAYLFVKKRFANVRMLVEPLGIRFLTKETIELNDHHRSDVILYNPNRSSEIMDKLLKREDLSFLPIVGFNETELQKLFQQSKLYVDFGLFPGPERLPKETVANGTLLLVGKRNAAMNDFDVAIPEQYKIEDYNNEELVAEKIKYMLENYNRIIQDFEGFRDKIAGLEGNFMRSIQEVFVRA